MDGRKNTKILQSAKTYFAEVVDNALKERKLDAPPLVSQYLVEMLNFFLVSENLHDNEVARETLAEAYLKASATESSVRMGRLKRLGDMSLYISGYFGDSLKRKVVDIDYYADIGGSAYSSLAASRNDLWTEVYEQFGQRFMDYVDVLTVISHKTLVQSSGDLLRIYDRYLVTGSKLAADQLVEQGLITPKDLKKASDQ